MSQFLQDEFLRNLSISDVALKEINECISEIAGQVNRNLQNLFKEEELTKKSLVLSYIIRFDGKGFRLFEFEKALKYFENAKRVERFLFILDSIESINRIQGKSIELRFDATDLNNCLLIVQDDDCDWVDVSFRKIRECLNKFRNKNFIIRGILPLIVQLFGVFFGFVISLWIAVNVSPKIAIENSMAFTFVIIFLLFSNIWTIFFSILSKYAYRFWPNILFKKRKEIHWLFRTIIGAIVLSILGRIFLYIGTILKTIIR